MIILKQKLLLNLLSIALVICFGMSIHFYNEIKNLKAFILENEKRSIQNETHLNELLQKFIKEQKD